MSSTTKSNCLLVAPCWWDRRALEVAKDASRAIEWCDTSDVMACNSFQEATSLLATRIATHAAGTPTWLIAYGDVCPLVISALQVFQNNPSASSMPSGLLLISGMRTSGSLSSRFKKIRFFHRVSNTFAAMKYSTLLKQAIANELTGTQAELCLRMLKESSRLALLKNLEWLLAWDSSRNEIDRLSVPIHQLHGRNDTFFDAPIPSEATLLGNAGHLLWFSHSRSVLEWIDAVARA